MCNRSQETVKIQRRFWLTAGPEFIHDLCVYYSLLTCHSALLVTSAAHTISHTGSVRFNFLLCLQLAIFTHHVVFTLTVNPTAALTVLTGHTVHLSH